MKTTFTRRRLIFTGIGIAMLRALPAIGVVNVATAAGTRARMATGIRGTTHSMAWMGVETGVFKKLGVEANFEKFTPGGPEIVTGLLGGDWEFGQTGTVPTAEAVLKGNDPVILLRNTAAHAGQFIMARPEYAQLEQLAGKIVGILSDTVSGQTGVSTRLTLEKAGVKVNYVGLGTFENIFKALAASEIDAGALPIHLRFPGQREFGWNAFAMVSTDLPSVFVTTRRLIESDPELVLRVVQGMVETIHLFKTQPNVAVPLLQRFLRINDRKAVEDLHEFYVPLFPAVPRADLGESGMRSLRNLFSKRFPAAEKLQESDLVDSSFIDQLDKSGFIERLYGKGKP